MMRRLTQCLMATSLVSVLTGCATPDPVEPPDVGPAFCLIEEPRRFSQEELNWRAANAPWNLRRDYKTNTSWEDAGCDGIRSGL